jgi:hypothetical protein
MWKIIYQQMYQQSSALASPLLKKNLRRALYPVSFPSTQAKSYTPSVPFEPAETAPAESRNRRPSRLIQVKLKSDECIPNYRRAA